ncbi:MAG TPA: hypothetical protein VEB00_02515 [Clostridia bacterium]|nr:hypothetical protein [Clostridia bacterium]
MYNAAIVIFRRSTLPKILNFFAMPSISQIIEVGNAQNKIKVHIIECPVMKVPADNRRMAKALKSLCMENSISFFIGKNTEYYFGSGMEHMESSIERGIIDEIKAIKGLAVLIKLSGEKNANLLKKNLCFVGESTSYQYVSTMSEEACGVFIYEHDKMDSSFKKAVFEKLMAEKGISAVFTKDLDRAISQSDIILADDSVDLEPYQTELTGKILVGDNSATGNFEKISQVLLWNDRLEGLSEDNTLVCFNDEMLGILRHFYKERSLIGFIKRFPYLYISRQ